LVIGGDIDRQQTLQWIAKYFGPIPRGPEVDPLVKQAGQLEQDRYVTLEDNIHLPAIAMLFPTVYYNHPDEAPLDAATKVLGEGRASLLYQRLVQSGRAVSAYVSHACRELACEMAFIVVQNPASGETLADMEMAVRETIAEFAENGLSEDDLVKFKAQMESGQIFSMQSVSGKVGALAFSEMFSNDPKTVQLDLARYEAVTREEVTRVFSQYLVDQPAVVLSVVPEGQLQLAAREQDYFIPEAVANQEESQHEAAEAVVLRTIQDDFDRSQQPAPGINPVVQLPPAWQDELANGIPVLGVANTETPTISLKVVFDLGQRDVPPEKAGLSNMMASLMNEATQTRTAAEFTEALERIGASAGVGSGSYETELSVNTLSKHLDAAMALAMERLLQPAFLEEDFERIKSRNMEALVQARKSGPTLAGRAVNSILQAEGSPLGMPGSGLPQTLESITLDEVKAFYAENLPGRIKGVLVSSNLPQSETMAALSALGELPLSQYERGPLSDEPEFTERTIYLVNRPDAAQSSVRIVHPSLPYDATGDYYLATMMNFNLGGTFDSRLNLDLREDKGWTYGAYTSFSGGQEFGRFQFSSEINKEATLDAINTVLEQIARYAAEGMTEEEFQYLQSAIGQRDALRYETPGAKLGLLDRVLTYNVPLDYRKQQQVILQETDRETLNALAARLLKPGQVAIVVAADVATVKPQLESLGLPIKIMDEDGFRVVESIN
jgi:zinc protease